MEETKSHRKGCPMKKILASLAAAGVLVAGVFTAAVITGSSATAQESPDDETSLPAQHPERGSAVKDVLDELVVANEITQDQADTILSALKAKWEELKADRPDGGERHRRGFRRGARFGINIAELLEDGVIDAAELAELPEGHPFTNPDGPFADAAADGQITEEELRDVLEQLREERGGRHGPRRGEEASDVEGANV